MRIRIFNTFEPVNTLYRDLVPHLLDEGDEVELILSAAEYREGRNLDAFFDGMANVKIVRMPSWGASPHTKPGKPLVMLTYMLHASLYTLFGRGVDRNIFLTQPPLLPLLGTILTKIRRQPYVVVVMDIYPQLLVEYGMMKRDAVVTRLLTWISTFTLKRASSVCTIARCMKASLVASGVEERKIHLVHNWINEKIVQPVAHEDNALRTSWGLQGKFVVLYSGNMGLSHYFDDMLAVAEQCGDRDDIAFVVIGGGRRRKEVEREVERRQLTNVLLKPFQDMELLTQSLGLGSVHLVSLRNECTGLAAPSKTYGILGAGRPVIYQGSTDGEIARMIKEEDVGFVIPIGDTDGLRRAIDTLYHDRDKLDAMGRRARTALEQRYSREKGVKRYGDVFHAAARSACAMSEKGSLTTLEQTS